MPRPWQPGVGWAQEGLMCLSWLLSQEHDGTDRSQCSMCGVSTHSCGPPKAPSWRHRKHGIWPWGPETCPLAPNTPGPLPGLFSSPKPHFFVFSGAEMSEALILVSPFTNLPPPPEGLGRGLEFQPPPRLSGSCPRILGSKALYFHTLCEKGFGPWKKGGGRGPCLSRRSNSSWLGLR